MSQEMQLYQCPCSSAVGCSHCGMLIPHHYSDPKRFFFDLQLMSCQRQSREGTTSSHSREQYAASIRMTHAT